MFAARPLLPFCIALMLLSGPALAGVATQHLISYQGQARAADGQAIGAGSVRVRIYDAPSGGSPVYDSGTQFNGAIVAGVFNVLLGSGAQPLLLDNTRQYHLELDLQGIEVIGDAASGRQAFWPGGGDHGRSDLETRISALEAMVFASCDPGRFDLNGNPADGCEFVLDSLGIYVDGSDPGSDDSAGCGRGPTSTCPTCRPCLTIARGLQEATLSGAARVHVANATYVESVTLVNGKSLLGGYHGGTWERDPTASATLILPDGSVSANKRTVSGVGITSPTAVDGFVIFGAHNAQPGGNSYAVHLSNAGGVTLRNNVVFAGSGGPGADGASGASGANGGNGGAGAAAVQSPTLVCSLPTRAGGTAGVSTCGTVGGGAGGGNRCRPASNRTEYSGLDGVAGSSAAGTGSAGPGGDAGDDSYLQNNVCSVPAQPWDGAAGTGGGAGSNGVTGSGASNSAGSVTTGHWLGSSGNAGTNGTAGGGGGGGGAGGGRFGTASPNNDAFGGAGGGGGAGGCGGGAGQGGGAGGGAFGVFIASAPAPAIVSNLIRVGVGGPGGRGGTAGVRGAGGVGGAGGTASLFCVGIGAAGGDGGVGGQGGGGGGGAGGAAYGIYASGFSAPSSYTTNNTFAAGTGGAGGSGGLSLGNPGTAGVAGPMGSVKP